MTDAKSVVADPFALLNSPVARPQPVPPRSRVVYLVLGVLFGWFGIHNWYARRTIVAMIQTIGGVFLVFSMVMIVEGGGKLEGAWVALGVYAMAYPVFASLWVLGDLIVVKECGDDVALEWSA